MKCEISQFILNYVNGTGDSSLVLQAIDIQILQKILPKLSGTEEEILELLNQLYSIVEKNNSIQSLEKLGKMIAKLQATGYVTFIE